MKNKIILSFLILICNTFIINAQTNISLYINGGPNYSPMSGVEHDLVSWERTEIDYINFSANAGAKYSLNEYSNIYVNFEYIPIDLSYGSIGSDIQYNLKIFPITIGYEYKLSESKRYSYYLGAGFGFAFSNSEYI